MPDDLPDNQTGHPAADPPEPPGPGPAPIPTRWAQATGGEAGEAYARRMAAATQAAAAAGEDAHGEARFVHDLALRELRRPAARILDAGCGTGRVAIALHELGHPVLGVDGDLSMLRVAAEEQPRIPFWLSDLAALDVPQAAIAAGFDVVVMAGNVVPYLAEGTLDVVLIELARVTRRDGYVVAGFGVHPSELPAGLPVTELAAYDEAAAAAGLELTARYAGWGREPYADDAPYVVSVHRLTSPPPPPKARPAATESGDGETPDAGPLPAGRIRSTRPPADATPAKTRGRGLFRRHR